jgi:hypothetical protein
MSSMRVWLHAVALGVCSLVAATSAQAQNVAPTVSGSPPTTAATGQFYSFQPTASDANGDALGYGISGMPRWASFNKRTGLLSGKPGARDVGTSRLITIAVSDGKLTTRLAGFTITVSAGGAPWIAGTPAMTVFEGQSYTFTPQAGDPEGERLTYDISNKPAWAAFSRSTGQLTGTPPAGTTGTYSGIRISVSDGASSTSLPTFSISVLAGASLVASTLSVSGTPPTQATVGSPYAFRPTVSSAAGATLTYSILNRPSWATFETSTGLLQGVPGSGTAGSYANVTIGVSDGSSTSSLAPFTITVTQPQGTGSATLSWQPPTQNVDGTPLQDLAGFRIVYGKVADNLDQVVSIPNPSITSAVVQSLTTGTWYFAVKAYTAANVQSDLSNLASKTIL